MFIFVAGFNISDLFLRHKNFLIDCAAYLWILLISYHVEKVSLKNFFTLTNSRKFWVNLSNSFLKSLLSFEDSWTIALVEAFIKIWLHMTIGQVNA